MFHKLTGTKGLKLRPESTRVHLLLISTSFMKDLERPGWRRCSCPVDKEKGLLKRATKMGETVAGAKVGVKYVCWSQRLLPAPPPNGGELC